MPLSCVAYDCTNRAAKDSGIRFFRIPKDERRELWVNAIKRKDWIPHAEDRICSAHFLTGQPNKCADHPDYVPSIFSFNESCDGVLERFKRRKVLENKRKISSLEQESTCDVIDVTPTTRENLCSEECTEKIKYLEEKVSSLEHEKKCLLMDLAAHQKEKCDFQAKTKELSWSVENMKDMPEKIKFYTGLLNYNLFLWLFNFIKTRIEVPEDNSLKSEDQFFLLLSRLRLGLLTSDLAYRYGVSNSYVSKTISKWLKITGCIFKNLIIWPDRTILRKKLPKCMKNLYPRCVAIIDCSEIKIQRPYGFTARQQTWSNYKSSNTIKFLLAIAPTGQIIFISKCWGGRVSDQQLTIQSEFLKHLYPHDIVLADRGFTSGVREAFAMQGAELIVPTYTKGKKQLSKREVEKSRQISNVRIHVERAIRRMKYFRILQCVPVTLSPQIDDMIITISALCNLLPPLVNN